MSEDFSKRPLGVIPSPVDERDWKITKLIPQEKIITTFPEEFEIPYNHDIKNQYSVGACVWHSFAYIREETEQKHCKEYIRLSPASGYLNRLDSDYQGVGLIPRQGLNTLVRDGISSWDIFPVNLEYPSGKTEFLANKEAILKDAFPHRITAYASLGNDINAIKNALIQLGGVSVCIPIYSSFYGISKQNPICPIPNKNSETLYGFHMVSIFGWRKDNTWITYNSWGIEWGDNGKFYLPFNFKLTEAYSITDNILPPSPPNYKLTTDTPIITSQLTTPITINVKLADSNNNSPVSGQFIQSMYSGLHQGGNVGTTDSNGIASFTLENPSSIGITNCVFVWFSNKGVKYELTVTVNWIENVEPQPEPMPNTLYHVLTVPFKNVEEANNFAKDLQTKGFQTYTAHIVQVSANSNITYAQNNLNKLKELGINGYIVQY